MMFRYWRPFNFGYGSRVDFLCRYDVIAGRLVTHAETRAGCEHARCDVHGEEFLKEQLGSVGYMDLGDASFVVAGSTLV
jgi:hypothetical protein